MLILFPKSYLSSIHPTFGNTMGLTRNQLKCSQPNHQKTTPQKTQLHPTPKTHMEINPRNYQTQKAVGPKRVAKKPYR